MEENLEMLNEVVGIANQLKPEWKASAQSCGHAGSGLASQSVFSFFRYRNLWIVRLCDGRVVYKEVSAEWLEVVSGIVLNSPLIFVEFDRHNCIISWAAIQEKGPIVDDFVKGSSTY